MSSRFYRGFDNTLIFPALMYLYGIRSASKYKFVPISWREEDQVSNARAIKQAVKIIRLAMLSKSLLRVADEAAEGYQFDVVASRGGFSENAERSDALAS